MGAGGSTLPRDKEGSNHGSDKRRRSTAASGTALADRLHRSRAAHLSQVFRANSLLASQEPGLGDEENDADSGRGACSPSSALGQASAQVDLKDYAFSFENLVLEGGGNKGIAYAGAAKCLEEHGVLSQIRRFGGCSVGAVIAALLACGYSASELEHVVRTIRFDQLFLDAKFGALSLLPNLAKTYGWHPGCKFYQRCGELLADKMGDPDCTFQQLYHKTGRELCVVITNLTQMSTEYCHPKTTPDMPIRLAVRMSSSIPVLFSAMKYSFTATHDKEDVIVDGGIMCNYPLHCFDGWYLSLKPEDTFLRRLQPLSEIPLLMQQRFTPTSDKTLGILLYSDADNDLMTRGVEQRYRNDEPAVPTKKTDLFLAWEREKKRKLKAGREHDKIVNAIDAFLRVIHKHNVDNKEIIDIAELEAAFQDKTEFPDEHAEALFGKDFTVEEAFTLLDYDGNGEIHVEELVLFIENQGVNLQTCFLGRKTQSIDGLFSFLGVLHKTLDHNVHKMHLQDYDYERSIGINTTYVGTTDFVLEKEDVQFLIERGYSAAKAFLQYFVMAHPDKVQNKSTGVTAEDSQQLHSGPDTPDNA